MKIIRISATLLTAMLAMSAGTASASAAAPRVAAGDLNIAITQGSATVVSGTSIKFKGTYSCNDALGAHEVTIAFAVGQGNGDGGHTATLNVPCQVTNGVWSATVPFSGIKTSAEVDAEATVVDNYLRATADARLVAHTAFIKANPTATVNSNGTVTISGTYGCSDTETADVIAEVNQIQAGGAAAIGVAAFTVACPATNAPWSSNVTMARIPISSTNPIEQSFDLTWGDGRARVLSSGELG
ncbi:hypothetical protein [Actinospica sp.]|uniref:hypothetical protein n=1 Tax=Actinospica sp. TaxID=1872142 RepID=UPI002C2EC331|nr:hypothetical protein [Actinospica sp.]HWG24245.1 hypothetical protein [Actinospica sp.]